MRRRAAIAACLLILPPLLPAAAGGPPPVVDVQRLEQVKPGWAVREAQGDASKGSLTVERLVWPMFYLHWFPRNEKAGDLASKEAEAMVSSLWPDKPVDGPLKIRPVALPAHPGFEMEGTRGHGEIRSRAFVWSCPQSGRVLVADTNLNLTVSAPELLMDFQRDMARTVRCHPGAGEETFGHLGRRFEIPESGLSFAHNEEWVPIDLYRPVRGFGQEEWEQATPRNTPELGQSLTVEADSFRRLYVSWGPTPDFPMSYEVLRQKLEDHWRERASDIVITDGHESNQYWFMNGIARPGKYGIAMPPTRMHKFRGYMWRRGDITWFAVAQAGGVRFGRTSPSLPFEAWNLKLEEMFQAIREP